MNPQIGKFTGRWLRMLCIPAVLMVAGGSAHAQLLSGLVNGVVAPVLGTVTGVVGDVVGTVVDLIEPSSTNYQAKRNATLVAADSALCRVEDRRAGLERKSYGTRSPRNRQLLNDCTLLGAPTTP